MGAMNNDTPINPQEQPSAEERTSTAEGTASGEAAAPHDSEAIAAHREILPAEDAASETAAESVSHDTAKPGETAETESTTESTEQAEEAEPASVVDESDEVSDEGAEAAPEPEAAPVSRKQWYVVKVQSGREDTIREAIERKVRKEGLEEFFGQIKIPVEKVTEVKQDKNGKKVTRTRDRRLYAGYIFVELEYNDRMLYLFRETSGVGGFVGEHPGQPERAPTPMSEREIQRILGGALPGAEDAKVSDVPPPPKGLNVGDHVRIVDGTFNGLDAVVTAIHAEQARVVAEVTIFGRPVSVDFEYYQIEQ
jgi:transcriptional antiterminator NusG